MSCKRDITQGSALCCFPVLALSWAWSSCFQISTLNWKWWERNNLREIQRVDEAGWTRCRKKRWEFSCSLTGGELWQQGGSPGQAGHGMPLSSAGFLEISSSKACFYPKSRISPLWRSVRRAQRLWLLLPPWCWWWWGGCGPPLPYVIVTLPFLHSACEDQQQSVPSPGLLALKKRWCCVSLLPTLYGLPVTQATSSISATRVLKWSDLWHPSKRNLSKRHCSRVTITCSHANIFCLNSKQHFKGRNVFFMSHLTIQ